MRAALKNHYARRGASVMIASLNHRLMSWLPGNEPGAGGKQEKMF
jgi:hypothetical protein